MLAAPLLGLMFVAFFLPLIWLLAMSVYDATIPDALPATMEAVKEWEEGDVPNALYPALAADLVRARENGSVQELARALNGRLPGIRTRILSAARAITDPATADRAFFSRLHSTWVEPETWKIIRSGASPWTGFYLLSALDLRLDAEGHIARVPNDQAIFLTVFLRTFLVSAAVTALTVVLALPVAYFAAQAPRSVAALVIALVLLPFWTSVLVRTVSWMVLLQQEGMVNQLLELLGIGKLQLMYSKAGLILSMVYVQLPFTFLPIYGAMRNIPPQQLRAAYSLGARPLTAFWRIYLPQARPGIAAGGLVTFILSVGYYLAPALIGGPGDRFISNTISNYISVELNWHMAAALSVVLLALTFCFYAAFGRYLSTPGQEVRK